MANIGSTSILTPTPGATITLTIDPTIRHHVASWTAAEVETVNLSGTPLDGQQLTLLITNDGTLGRVITLGTGFSGNGTIVGVISKRSIWFGIAVGGVFYEVARTVGVLT
jgi:hypothetical protein